MKQTEKVKYSPALIENISDQANILKSEIRLLKKLVLIAGAASLLSTVVILFTVNTDRLPDWRIFMIGALVTSLVSLLYSLITYLVKSHMLDEIMQAKRSLNH